MENNADKYGIDPYKLQTQVILLEDRIINFEEDFAFIETFNKTLDRTSEDN